jgi:two-component system KDP operon response regulator KdpE
MHAAHKILIVDDDAALRQSLAEQLDRDGEFVSVECETAGEALETVGRERFDAILLDVGLPDMDGRELCRALRNASVTVPIVMLTAADSDGDTVQGLDAGANDYVTKPFDIEELLARLRAALRRDTPVGAAEIMLGRWKIDLVAYTAVSTSGDGEVAHLTPTEWRLLELLLQRPGQLVPARRLLNNVWGPGYERSTNYLRFHMARLRRKLEEDPSRPRYLLTEPGMGYRYQPDGAPPGRHL